MKIGKVKHFVVAPISVEVFIETAVDARKFKEFLCKYETTEASAALLKSIDKWIYVNWGEKGNE